MRRESVGLVRWTGWPVVMAALVWVVLAAGEVKGQEAAEKKGEEKQAAGQAASGGVSEGFQWGAYQGRSTTEVGYRWVDVKGSEEMYRSMVNLGAGPKLLHTDLTLRSGYGEGKLFDHLGITMDNWGGDPYNTIRFNFGRTGAYEVNGTYLNQNYFNWIPSFDNPLFLQGSTVDQHRLDVGYRTLDVELKLFPTFWVRPVFEYARTTGFGPGLTTESFTGNEFVLGQTWHYAADDYLWGMEFAVPRVTVNLEQGFRFLQNDTGVNWNGDSTGNNPNGFLGEQITLSGDNRGYHDRTNIPIFRGTVKATPLSWMRFTGRYIYAMADTDGVMNEIATGNLATFAERIFYQAQSDSFSTRAKSPQNNGSFVLEMTPLSRLSVTDQFQVRTMHVSGSGLLATTYYDARPMSGQPVTYPEVDVSEVVNSYLSYSGIQNQLEAEVGVWGSFYARGGWRYSDTKATVGGAERRSALLIQQTAIAGVAYRQGHWLELAVDYEDNNPSAHSVMRTDLFDYSQVKFDWKVGTWKGLSANGNVAVLTNRNAQSDIDLSGHNRNYTVAVNYDPGERLHVSVDYMKSSIYSDMAIILPQTLQTGRSVYDESLNGVGGSVGVGLYRGSRFDFGYRGIYSTGSYPLNYHQPYAQLTVPLHNHLAVKGYWQYHDYNQKGLSLQSYHANLATVSLVVSY
jgi:hypothetical protein